MFVKGPVKVETGHMRGPFGGVDRYGWIGYVLMLPEQMPDDRECILHDVVCFFCVLFVSRIILLSQEKACQSDVWWSVTCSYPRRPVPSPDIKKITRQMTGTATNEGVWL